MAAEPKVIVALLVFLFVALPIAVSIGAAILDFRLAQWLWPWPKRRVTTRRKVIWIALDTVMALPLVAPIVWAVLIVVVALLWR